MDVLQVMLAGAVDRDLIDGHPKNGSFLLLGGAGTLSRAAGLRMRGYSRILFVNSKTRQCGVK